MRPFAVVLVLALLFSACGERPSAGPQTPSARSGALVLRAGAMQEDQEIILDGTTADPFWRTMRWLTVPLTGPGPSEVEMKAASDGRRLYLLARWSDDERSMDRYWSHVGGWKWEKSTGEDGLAICWSPGSTAERFRAEGCALFCHDGSHRLLADGGAVDYWSWLAQQTRPVNQARDMVLRAGKQHRLRGDGQPEDSGNMPNINPEGDGPRYVPFRIHRGPDRDRLLFPDNVQELPEQMKIDPHRNIGWEVPTDILRPMRGSRGDVAAAARYARGVWILELSRALSTGNGDDQPLGDPLVPALFSIAVYDGAEKDKKAVSGPIELRFLTDS